MTARVVMRIVIADQRMPRHGEARRHFIEQRPLRIAGVLHIVAGELHEVRTDQRRDFVGHPKRGGVIVATGDIEVQVARPDEGDSVAGHRRRRAEVAERIAIAVPGTRRPGSGLAVPPHPYTRKARAFRLITGNGATPLRAATAERIF